MHSWRSILAALALLAMVAAALPATVRAAQDIPTENVEAIEKIVREYLLRNPEVLLEAMEVLEKRREEIAQARRREALVASRSELLEEEKPANLKRGHRADSFDHHRRRLPIESNNNMSYQVSRPYPPTPCRWSSPNA